VRLEGLSQLNLMRNFGDYISILFSRSAFFCFFKDKVQSCTDFIVNFWSQARVHRFNAQNAQVFWSMSLSSLLKRISVSACNLFSLIKFTFFLVYNAV
jgi:hypothetical protein